MPFIRKDFTTLTEREIKEEVRKEMKYRTGDVSRYHYHIAVELCNTYSFLHNEWEHFPEKHFIKDRFVKKTISVEFGKEDFPIPPATTPTKKTCGLYLIGTTTFNPYTNKPFFWIKIGKSEDLEKRMKSYYTHSPSIWKIDFQEVPKSKVDKIEKLYHALLSNIGINSAEHSKEWYEVSKEDYLKICNEKFDFFKFDLLTLVLE